MKLSEAIRLGAMMRPQAFEAMWETLWTSESEQKVASCALGAACDALGCRESQLEVIFPELCDPKIVTTPFNGRRYCNLQRAITQLNDTARWTREQIADWLDEREAQEDARRLADQKHEQEVLVNRDGGTVGVGMVSPVT